MKEFIKSAINEAFGGTSPLNVIKRIVAMFITIFFIFVCQKIIKYNKILLNYHIS